jgi:ribose-phosphate pyrophosphokinase
MSLRIIDGGANTPLAELVAGTLGVGLGRRVIGRFPDEEARVQLIDPVVGDDVFIIQPTSPPPDAHLMELLLLADSAIRGGAARVTAVVPYFGYARQDHNGGRPIAASVVARMMESVGISQVIAVDLHSRAVEMSFGVPVRHLSAVPLLAGCLGDMLPRESVIVAPDLGAAKLADRYATMLRLPVAFVRKERIGAADVKVHGVTGEVRGRTPVIVDDMVSTAGTIVAAAGACIEAGANESVVVAATHVLLVGTANERLQGLPLRSLFGTDSVAMPAITPACIERVSLAELLANEIADLHGGRGATEHHGTHTVGVKENTHVTR